MDSNNYIYSSCINYQKNKDTCNLVNLLFHLHLHCLAIYQDHFKNEVISILHQLYTKSKEK